MNRTRWIAVAAVLVLLVGAALAWNRETFAFDAAYRDPDAKVVIVRYGDSGSCPSKDVRHTVVQKPDRVIVTLTRERIPRACDSDYRPRLVRISLTEPLAGRTVIDGSRTKPVPSSTGTPPLG